MKGNSDDWDIYIHIYTEIYTELVNNVSAMYTTK